MTLTTVNLPTVADVLRGDRSRRPLGDHLVAGGLRAELEDLVFGLSQSTGSQVATLVHASDMRAATLPTNESGSPVGRLRGLLIVEIMRLLVVGEAIDDPYLDAVAAFRSANVASSLVDVLASLDCDDVARLATEVTAHAVTLSSRLGALHPGWRPRTSVPAIARLGAGSLILKDRFDLVVGSTHTTYASVALLDVTTAALSEHHERVLRFHALVQTIVTGVAPLRVVVFSSATAELWSFDVDAALLRRALDELSAVVTTKWSAR